MWELAASRVDVIFAVPQLTHLEMPGCWAMCVPSRAEGSAHTCVCNCAGAREYFFMRTQTSRPTGARFLQRSSLGHLELSSGTLPQRPRVTCVCVCSLPSRRCDTQCGRQHNGPPELSVSSGPEPVNVASSMEKMH